MIEIRSERFDPLELQRQYEASVAERMQGACGATATFIGTTRDFNEGDDVATLTLEHYPEMTEKVLEEISTEAAKRWQIIDSLIVHRIGEMEPGEPIVLVCVWSSHRKEAFEACRHLMEELKSRAPFWKKEATDVGDRWVAQNTSGY